MTSSPDFYHQDIVSDISRKLGSFVFERGSGKVIVAPMNVYFNSQNIYQPDIILFLQNASQLLYKMEN